MSADSLYLIRLELPLRGIMALARRRRLPQHEFDEGQAVHCALGELFRDYAPRPFALPNERSRSRKQGCLDIHAYSSVSKSDLLQRVDAFGDIELHEQFDRSSLKERTLPERFPEVVGFSVRLCPIVRMSRDVRLDVSLPGREGSIRIERKSRNKKRRGCEVDAFEAACIRSHREGLGAIDSAQRGEIYLDWFRELASRIDGIEVETARLQAQRWTHLWRRDHAAKRTSRKLCRPDVVVTGRLRISDQSQLRERLRRGIGRHKAFGFGMLLLRPAGEV